jgi:hypothetical protein
VTRVLVVLKEILPPRKRPDAVPAPHEFGEHDRLRALADVDWMAARLSGLV